MKMLLTFSDDDESFCFQYTDKMTATDEQDETFSSSSWLDFTSDDDDEDALIIVIGR